MLQQLINVVTKDSSIDNQTKSVCNKHKNPNGFPIDKYVIHSFSTILRL